MVADLPRRSVIVQSHDGVHLVAEVAVMPRFIPLGPSLSSAASHRSWQLHRDQERAAEARYPAHMNPHPALPRGRWSMRPSSVPRSERGARLYLRRQLEMGGDGVPKLPALCDFGWPLKPRSAA